MAKCESIAKASQPEGIDDDERQELVDSDYGGYSDGWLHLPLRCGSQASAAETIGIKTLQMLQMLQVRLVQVQLVRLLQMQ